MSEGAVNVDRVTEPAFDASPVAPFLAAPVVSTQWLADHLGSDTLLVLDATVLRTAWPHGGSGWLSGYDQYLVDGHVPGAVFADLLESFSDTTGRHGFAKPSAPQFEQAAASVGADNDTTIIVYDASVGQWAARLWWLFRAFGYDRVAVLDGGLSRWRAEERPTQRGWVPPADGRVFRARPRPELWADKQKVRSVLAGETDAALVCGLAPREFSGEVGQRPRLGHIPGSLSVPAVKLVDRTTNQMLPPALQGLFADALAASSHIIAYCGAGITAAADALALAVIGHTDVSLYDGSLNEWAADPELPLVSSGPE
jgi:thiosulfate/3-mercaptopyruvate sulfurtransferase